jgi:hypothetical protein
MKRASSGQVSASASPVGLYEPETSGDPGYSGLFGTAQEARQEGSPARQRWERLLNHDERRRRGTGLSHEAIELCRPSGAGHRFCRLPRAYALGYLPDAPYGAGLFGHGALNRLGRSLKTRSFCRGHDFTRAVKLQKNLRFNPCRERPQCLKAESSKRSTARLKSCSDTCPPPQYIRSRTMVFP